MNIIIAAVGKIKAGAELTLIQNYIKLSRWHIAVKEVEEKRTLPSAVRKKSEADMLLDAVSKADFLIALDERGQEFRSLDFASELKIWEQKGTVAFIIGGAEGLDESVRQKADLLISFGKMTWPHFLIRAMLTEQLYRCRTIIDGHPYHKE